MESEYQGVKLSEKQKAFCKHYVSNGWNGTQAAISAGYSENSANEIAAQNLAKLSIKEYVKYLKTNEGIEEQLGLSKQKVVNEAMKLAFSSIANLHNTWIERKEFEQLKEDNPEILDCISEISTQIRKQVINEQVFEVEFVKLKLYSKDKALEIINKMMGYNAEERLKVTGNMGFVVQVSNEKTAKLIESLGDEND